MPEGQIIHFPRNGQTPEPEEPVALAAYTVLALAGFGVLMLALKARDWLVS